MVAETFRLRINIGGSLTGWCSESPAFGKLQNAITKFEIEMANIMNDSKVKIKLGRKKYIKVFVATVVGAITIFLLGYLIFGILFAPYMQMEEIQYNGLRKVPPDFLLLILKNIVQAFLLVYIFEFLTGIRTFLGGMKVGAIIMFLITLSLNLSLLSIMNLNNGYTANILDIAGETVRMALGGGIIGMVLGLMNKGE